MKKENKLKTYTLFIRNVGYIEIKSTNSLDDVINHKNTFYRSLSIFLKKHNLTILQYINDNVIKLELCGFCNKHFSNYLYDVYVENNELKFTNIRLKSDYSCNDKECINERKNLNSNSFEHIAKRKKISLEEADKWQKENNKSPFYLHPGESKEEYGKRQSRGIDFFKLKYKDDYLEKWKEHCKKISISTREEAFISRYGEEFNKKVQESKKQTLENFIKRYGEIDGKEKYKQWLFKITHIGKYIDDKRAIDSKQAYNFFVKLENLILNENICEKEDILYCDGKDRGEYKVLYFNEENKLRFFCLDFTILKYKIDIEFNGGCWHYNIENEDKISNKETMVYYNDNAKDYEIRRNRIVTENGFKIIKIWDYEVKNDVLLDLKLNEVLLKIKEYINLNVKK